MDFNSITVRKTINKAFLKEPIERGSFESFKDSLEQFHNEGEIAKEKNEHEEHFKNFLVSFFNNVGFDDYFINTSARIDLAIHTGKKGKDPVGVLIEAKRPGNAAEMITKEQMNRKAMHEAVLYYLEQRIEKDNSDLKHIIITDMDNWFIFDAQEFERCFYKPSALRKTWKEWKSNRKVSSTNDFMYDEISKFIDTQEASISGLWLPLDKTRKLLTGEKDSDYEKKLIPIYKLFTPTHLLKEPFANDSNSLNKEFYRELLYILGLEETKEGSTRYIQRAPDDSRNRGSVIENTIRILDAEDHLSTLNKARSSYGTTKDEQLFSVAMELGITWMNRILFLKLLEAQLYRYHRQDKTFKFLNFQVIDSLDELNKLFFQVLARKEKDRTDDVNEKFGHIPYLNSSLFDVSSLEHQTTRISGLDDHADMPVYSRSVLTKQRGETVNTLDYLFQFLEAYDFSAEGSEEIRDESKSLINASVLGLIFEKINGYKDGSFYTPGFITEYMARETLQKSVTDAFNKKYTWSCTSFDDLYNEIHRQRVPLKEANDVINDLKICDPAVGSGHFLVSCLNEMIAIKSGLDILCDRDGKLLRQIDVTVENDELIISWGDEGLFEYDVSHTWKGTTLNSRAISSELERVQKTLFHEKRYLIENCLFGVDINPNSVKICRLRLWIELLKRAYYTPESEYMELEVLPNIDINIKQGNSLVSRFELDSDLSTVFKNSDHSLDDYKKAVRSYKQTGDRTEKQRLQQLIDDIKEEYTTTLTNNRPINQKLSKARGRLEIMQSDDLFGDVKFTKKEIKKQEKKLKTLEEQKAEEESGAFYNQAFEWRFEFPEVLDEGGRFTGFDVVIGNPPYDVVEKNRNEPLKPYSELRIYLEKTGRYSKVEGGKLNIYRLFIQLFIELSRKNANLSFITQLSLLADTSVSNTRNFLFEKTSEIILDCFPQKDDPKKRVFEEAKVSTVITQAKVTESNDSIATCRLFPFNSFNDDHKRFVFNFSDLKLLDEKNLPIPLVSEFEFNLLKKLYKSESVSKFRDVPQIKTRRGEINQTTYKKYITSKNNHKKLLKGAEIAQYMLRKKMSQGEFKWFNEELFLKDSNPKDVINYRRIGLQRITGVDERLRLVGTIVGKNVYFADSTNSVHLDGETNLTLEFLLGLLNSSLYQWRFKLTSTNNNVGTNEIDVLPIVDISKGQKQKIGIKINSNVKQILSAKKENPEADTSALEAKIDQLVYDLYGLSEEEIGIVEGSVN